MCENYLLLAHKEDINKILESPDKEKYFSVNINFVELFDSDTNLGNAILTDPEVSLKNWNEAVLNVQTNLLKEPNNKYTLKNNTNCRIYNLPPWPHVSRTIFPGNDDANKFLQLTGTVVRMSARKLLEYQRQYICVKCKYPITVQAIYDKRNIIKQPKKCSNPEGCNGKNIINFGELDTYNCKDYQEIKIQEDLSKLGVGTIPNHMVVTLDDDLVNVCKPGENVTITGVVTRRWSEFDKGAKIVVDIVLRANHIQVNNSTGLSIAVSDDMKQFFDSFWETHMNNPLVGRNIILRSIAPEIYGLHLVKLAIAIVLAGGSQSLDNEMSMGVDVRSESHLLFVGDPGTGKSQMLRFASKIIPRSVLTTGVGSTAAGLTVTAVMDNGEWQLEAGALVMADGGICCIDEFNSMREHDRTSIHEAMEQQTISVAKAGIVCKLKTRCSILAACNPKGNINPSQPLCVNVAMSSPLLSRFDLILLLRDVVNEDNDRRLAEYLLNKGCQLTGEGVVWSLEKLQAYYAVIRKETPKLSNEAQTILSTYYQLQRKFATRNKSRTTVRLLESLIRLSQGHAKLMYHSEVQVIDAIFAVTLMDTSMDFETSLLNLKLDYNSFFDNPEELYWDLLETVLGKLNLDYIYQREIEKTGVEFRTTRNRQNSNLDVSDETEETRSNLADISQTSEESILHRQLFSQNTVSTVARRSQSLESHGSNLNPTNSAHSGLFTRNTLSQRDQNVSQTNTSFDTCSQSLSQNSQKAPEGLLFTSQIRRAPAKSFNDTKDSGNYSDLTVLDSQNVHDSHTNFNKPDENAQDRKGKQKENDPSDGSYFNKPTTSKKLESTQKVSKGAPNNKEHEMVPSHKKSLTLSQIVRSRCDMDFDLDFDQCFPDVKSSANKGVLAASVSASISRKGIEKSDNVLQQSEVEQGRKSNTKEIKSPIDKGKKRRSNAPSKTTTKKSKAAGKRIENEMDLIKLMPSVNDDFIKFDKAIDWDLEEEIHGEDTAESCTDSGQNSNPFGRDISTKIMKFNILKDCDEKHSKLDSGNNRNSPQLHDNQKERDQFKDVQTKPKRTFSNLHLKFDFKPRDKTKDETSRHEDWSEFKDNIDEKGRTEESRSIECDDFTNSKPQNTIKRFPSKNDSNMQTNQGLKNNVNKLNFNWLSSNVDFARLDEEIDSFEETLSQLERSSKLRQLGSNSECDNSDASQVGGLSTPDLDLATGSKFNPFNKKANVSQKPELFNLTQNSKKDFIRNKFVFKRDVRQMPRSDSSNISD